jgi:hypothetical protein
VPAPEASAMQTDCKGPSLNNCTISKKKEQRKNTIITHISYLIHKIHHYYFYQLATAQTTKTTITKVKLKRN